MADSRQDPLGVREFLARDWAGLAALKDVAWKARSEALSADERWQAVDDLRAWTHALHPERDWEVERRQDLEHHVRLAALFRRADARSPGPGGQTSM